MRFVTSTNATRMNFFSIPLQSFFHKKKCYLERLSHFINEEVRVTEDLKEKRRLCSPFKFKLPSVTLSPQEMRDVYRAFSFLKNHDDLMEKQRHRCRKLKQKQKKQRNDEGKTRERKTTTERVLLSK